MEKPMMGKITLSIISIISIILLSIASWVSCSSSVSPSSTRSARSGSTTSSSSSTADDDEDVEECTDRESCEDECNKIYDAYQEKNECEDLDVDEVVDLGRVYNALHNGRLSDLENISDETDDVDQSMFGDYLEIGLSGWTRCIKNWGLATPRNCLDTKDISDSKGKENLKNTLKWLIDEDDVANVLKGHDDEYKVIKELVLSLKAKFGKNSVVQAIGEGNHIGLDWFLSDAKSVKCDTAPQFFSTYTSDLVICKDTGTSQPTNNIDLSTSDKEIYDALSVTIFGTGSEADKLNIFSYSASGKNKDKGGEDVFEMAYGLLDRICNKEDGDQKLQCRKAMMCWTHYQTDTDGTEYDTKFDVLVKAHQSDLEDDGDYDNCTPVDGFANI